MRYNIVCNYNSFPSPSTHKNFLDFTCRDGGWGKPLAFGCVGWFLGGKIHSKRAVAKANKKHTESQKQLYSQYYKDVLLLQTQNAELEQHLQEYQKHHLDGEFEAADLNDDDRVSRAEFNAYKARYLKKHPEMADQFPSFESFDPDRNGFITKEEHDDFYKTL